MDLEKFRDVDFRRMDSVTFMCSLNPKLRTKIRQTNLNSKDPPAEWGAGGIL